MKNETFVDKAKKRFSFLKTNFDFRLYFEKISKTHPETDGIVKYKSGTTLLLIDSELGQVAVRFVRVQDNEKYYLDPVSIHEYLNTNEQEKQILLSRNGKNQEAANTIFRNTYLLSKPNWKNSGQDVYTNMERQLENYAKWLKENAHLCLLGDFSRWPDFYEYKINRLIADELRGGAKEVVLAIVKDENGKFTTIKRPIFHSELEHLARIRKEIVAK